MISVRLRLGASSGASTSIHGLYATRHRSFFLTGNAAAEDDEEYGSNSS